MNTELELKHVATRIYYFLDLYMLSFWKKRFLRLRKLIGLDLVLEELLAAEI